MSYINYIKQVAIYNQNNYTVPLISYMNCAFSKNDSSFELLCCIINKLYKRLLPSFANEAKLLYCPIDELYKRYLFTSVSQNQIVILYH